MPRKYINTVPAQNDEFVVVDRDDVSDYNDANILPESPESMEKIAQWLSPTAFDTEGSEYRKHLASHIKGTSGWLTSTGVYQKWHDSAEDGLLWIKGIPGSGKSVFAAHLVDKLSHEGTPVLFFFFRQIIDANHSPVSLLRDWLFQILHFSPPLQQKLNQYIKNGRSLDSLSVDDLWKDLRLGLSHQPRVYAVADALDEMDLGNETFLQALVELGQWRPNKIKLVMTSRPVATIETPLRSTLLLKIRLEERLVDIDIATYVNHRLSDTAISDKDRTAIREAVPGRANGLFLYARLAMDAFFESNVDVQEVIKQLPLDLNVMYTNLLREHAQRSDVPHELQFHILQWVTHASRPLRLLELAEIINTTFNRDTDRDLKATKALVRATCGPLIEILPDETVSVVHHSLTEFLKGSTRKQSNNAKEESTYPVLALGCTHSRLALACLKYLMAGCLEDIKIEKKPRYDACGEWEPPTRNDHAGVRMKYPFIDYAAANWHVHALKSGLGSTSKAEIDEIHGLLDTFLKPSHLMDAWLNLSWPNARADNVTPIHVAAWAGLTEYGTALLDRTETSINGADSFGETPLHYAAVAGRLEFARVLLECRAEPGKDDETGWTPLHMAANSNHAGIVKLLLDVGADPHTPKTKGLGPRYLGKPGDPGDPPESSGHSPLFYACRNGHLEAVTEFLPFLTLDTAQLALCWAASKKHSRVVAKILEYPGIKVDCQVQGTSALFRASCQVSDFKTMEVLIKAGADPNLRCKETYDDYHYGGELSQALDPSLDSEMFGRGFTPMHAFAGLSRRYQPTSDSDAVEAAFQLLVRAGGNVNIHDQHGKTPLHYASDNHGFQLSGGYDPIIARLLLDAGANPNLTDDNGEAPLHLSMSNNSESLMRLLIEQGEADINQKASDGRPPLFYLLHIAYLHRKTLRFLQYRPDLSITDKKGNGPLHAAQLHWNCRGQSGDASTDVVRALIEAGADPRAKNRDGETPLHSFNVHIAPILLQAGADLEAQDNNGYTVLFKGARSVTEDTSGVMETLIGLGARTDTRDFKGRTLLHATVSGYSSWQALRFLLNIGVDPKLTDYDGNTLLHSLAASYTGTIASSDAEDGTLLSKARELVSLGIDPDKANNSGRTPLHVIAGSITPRPKLAYMQPLDAFVAICLNVNSADHDGITPLHLACTIDHYNVGRLLEAGADAAACTCEGLTPLHLSARARQSNIIGMILDHYASIDAEKKHEIVNSPDKDGRTPLHYACRSGRFETVLLLLEAGADPNIKDRSGCTPLRACTEFEDEQKFWTDFGQYREVDDRGLQAGGVRICDQARPHLDPTHYYKSPNLLEQETTRLEEILDVLVAYGANPSTKVEVHQSFASTKIAHGAHLNYDYTKACMLSLYQKHRRQVDSEPHVEKFDELISRYRNEAVERALRESAKIKPGQSDESLLVDLLGSRQYHLVELMAKEGMDFLHESQQGETHLRLLAKWGFSRLLASIGNPKIETKLKKIQSSEEWISRSIDSILVQACERDLPNLEVLKVLVEDMKIDVNAHRIKPELRPDQKLAPGDTALHVVATGKQWWHVAQALPYLLAMGADIEAKDKNGKTALQIALDAHESNCGYFHKRAVEVLLEHGADVNAVNPNGDTCVATASWNVDLVKLLLQHGAKVTGTAVFAAIDYYNVEMLEALLLGGADPNAMRPPLDSDDPTWQRIYGNRMDYAWDDEAYPVYYAAYPAEPSLHGYRVANPIGNQEVSKALIRVLLAHGADPYLSFRKGGDGYDENGEIIKGSRATIIHELLHLGQVIQPFLEMPSLDVDRRDEKGRTLLLTACASLLGPDAKIDNYIGDEPPQDTGTPSVATLLLSKGADTSAKDETGLNALHLIFERGEGAFSAAEETLDHLLFKAPGLLRDQNNIGESPFHYALRDCHDTTVIERLITAGADVHTPDAEGNTALHLMAKNICVNHKSLFLRLRELGLPVDSRNHNGDTPLFSYIQSWHTILSLRDMAFDNEKSEWIQPYRDLVPLFTWAGADLFARNNAGKTLLHLVAAKQDYDEFSNDQNSALRRVEMFKYFMELGLDPMAEDGQQRTSLDIAAACGNVGILKLFERHAS